MQAAFDANGGTFVNNEFIDVYLVTVKDEIPLGAFTLQESEVSAVRQMPICLDWALLSYTFVFITGCGMDASCLQALRQ